MQCYLRFQCYDDPSRQATSQIHPDIPVDKPPHYEYGYGYGQHVRVGHDVNDPTTWLCYVVAHITHLRQIADPNDVGKNALLVEVFLARYEQWPQFCFPAMAEEPVS